MKISLLSLFGFLAAAFCASAAPVCPSTSNTNTDCGFMVTIQPDLSLTTMAVPGANPYDGADDALVGITNNSDMTFDGSFPLSGSGNGGGIFAFDGDGICTYVSASYCATATTGYEGPGVTFSGINSSGTTGTVNVSNLAAGTTTYFSLEGSPASISGGGGINTPEPASVCLFGFGSAAALLVFRRRRATNR